MQTRSVLISDANLKKLILEIYEYRDRISKVLDDAALLVESIKDSYKTEDGDNFRAKFQKFYSTFPVFVNNIQSYGTDLEFVLSKFKTLDAKNVDIFRNK